MSQATPTPGDSTATPATALAVAALRWLPKSALSRAAGRAAALRLPGPIQRAEIRAFGRLVGVNFDELRDPIDSFSCLQDFFVRALAPGARPIDPAPDAVVAPCDGAWGAAGRVRAGSLLQVKGRPYSLAALLGDEALAKEFEGGAFATFYLSPRDYHRFHTPLAVQVQEARHLPGSLWPVNEIGVQGVDGLFARNERISAVFATRDAGTNARIAIVAVGATMVGKVRVAFDELSTNLPGAEAVHRSYGDGGARYAKGAEWGRFEFGSTLVMVAEPGLLELDRQEAGAPLVLGTRIGRLLSSAD